MTLTLSVNRIVDNFDRAAETYDLNAEAQPKIALQLMSMLGQIPEPKTILEIGCGTGNMTRLLAERFPESNVQATDASLKMLEVARQKMSSKRVQFSQLELNQNTTFENHFDLLVSSMTLQWVEGLLDLLKKTTTHAKRLAFSIPIQGTFANWIEAHRRLGLDDGVIDFHSRDDLENALRRLVKTKFALVEQDFTVHYESPLDFVRSLKHMGAANSRSDYSSVNLRTVFKEFPNGIDVTYRVAFVLIERVD